MKSPAMEQAPFSAQVDFVRVFYVQLHSSLNGGSLGQGGSDEALPPGAAPLPLGPDPPDPPLEPWPPVPGPVGTLQNVAVISSIQKTPVDGGGA